MTFRIDACGQNKANVLTVEFLSCWGRRVSCEDHVVRLPHHSMVRHFGPGGNSLNNYGCIAMKLGTDILESQWRL